MKKYAIIAILILMATCPASAQTAPCEIAWPAPEVGTPPFTYTIEVSANGGAWVELATGVQDTLYTTDLSVNVKWRSRVAATSTVEVEQADGTVDVFTATGEWSEPSRIWLKPEVGRVGGCTIRGL